ncbi:hypothetical protein LOTGIDRAFT_216606 [Lottia gigantea]|uniref:long-chain-fatty-acid--CoA ligase n=1 Tax=Lottia gigantea TaxID=225164 RepID=V4AGI6_LOTGI|nr:hypothetical protein LOTGIDRAFT_216606 [Lottia gigantea]ESO92526.1 hypothetical protein LOTGIDRAFT_216606 [Lottia gigantea]
MIEWILSFIVALVAAAVATVYIFFPWLKYDIKLILATKNIITDIERRVKQKELIIDTFESTVKSNGEKAFIVYNDEKYTYKYVNQQADKVANLCLNFGLKKRETVAIMIQNEPAFLWTYLGLQKLGIKVALINYHLRKKALSNSVICCQSKALIVGQEAVEEIADDIKDVTILVQNDTKKCGNFKSFNELLKNVESVPVDPSIRDDLHVKDVSSFVFTSGTTGFPKPATVSMLRTIASIGAFSIFGINENDILYETLPLYHASALHLGVLNVINKGATLVLRSKFSASAFWDECRKYDVTIIHYIGELCRYLVAKPKLESDGKNHKIRVAVGNGLRQDIWQEFQQRFQIPQILEFYAATESPIAFQNIFNKVGSCGRCSPLLRKLNKVIFIKFDPSTQQPLRNSNGQCILLDKDGEGLMLAPAKGSIPFEGYYNRPADTEKKIIKNVISEGDMYYNSGDIFYIDKEYFLYFKDRTGDAYRWKGENVSSTEVSGIVNNLDFVHDTNVYGVTVPGCEGKAGMAAVHLKEGASVRPEHIQQINKHCNEQLPTYARPRFLRFQRQMSLTSTFKQQKVDLVEEGFNPNRIDEEVYYYDTKQNEFKPLDNNVYQDINTGKLQL